MTVYGYARVSSKGQQRDGTSLEAQERALRGAGADEVVSEAFTGTTMERPGFTSLLSRLVEGDELVVTKMDRFARTAADGSRIMEGLLDRGVTVNILNMGRMDATPAGKLMRTMMLAFAEFERDMVVTRLSEGREAAGNQGGRKPLDIDRDDLEDARRSVADGSATVTEVCGKLGISRSTWYRIVNKVA